jgi:hypothetical protein
VYVLGKRGDDADLRGRVLQRGGRRAATVAGGAPFAATDDGMTIEEAEEVHDCAGHLHVIADAGCVTRAAARLDVRRSACVRNG